MQADRQTDALITIGLYRTAAGRVIKQLRWPAYDMFMPSIYITGYKLTRID